MPRAAFVDRAGAGHVLFTSINPVKRGTVDDNVRPGFRQASLNAVAVRHFQAGVGRCRQLGVAGQRGDQFRAKLTGSSDNGDARFQSFKPVPGFRPDPHQGARQRGSPGPRSLARW